MVSINKITSATAKYGTFIGRGKLNGINVYKMKVGENSILTSVGADGFVRKKILSHDLTRSGVSSHTTVIDDYSKDCATFITKTGMSPFESLYLKENIPTFEIRKFNGLSLI